MNPLILHTVKGKPSTLKKNCMLAACVAHFCFGSVIFILIVLKENFTFSLEKLCQDLIDDGPRNAEIYVWKRGTRVHVSEQSNKNTAKFK